MAVKKEKHNKNVVTFVIEGFGHYMILLALLTFWLKQKSVFPGYCIAIGVSLGIFLGVAMA